MNKKAAIIGLLLAVILAGAGLKFFIFRKGVVSVEANEESITKQSPPERVGEKIVYDVKLGAISLGTAVFNQLPAEQVDGQRLNLMTFETAVTSFHDLEKIYSDPQTVLPVRVERTINKWGAENIVEEYDQKNYRLKVTKQHGKRKEETVIEKTRSIQNSVLLPYSVRNTGGELSPGWSLSVTLPTQEFQIKLIDIRDVTVPAGTFKSYFFTSIPKKFEIWITADDRRIPVQVAGTSGFGYILKMKEYKSY